MKIIFLLLCSFFILSVSPPKNRISKEIIGVWVFHFRGTFTAGPIRIWIKTRREPKQYDGFEFKKAGELLVHSQVEVDLSGDDEVYEQMILPGKWSVLNDSTIQIDYLDEEAIKIHKKFCLYKTRKLELKQLKDY
jgi:hypothetical protein